MHDTIEEGTLKFIDSPTVRVYDEEHIAGRRFVDFCSLGVDETYIRSPQFVRYRAVQTEISLTRNVFIS